MRIYLFILLSIFSSFSYAQQIYEFSDLKWGSSFEQSELQLKNSGYKITRQQSIICRVTNNCDSLDFEGFGITGSASFEDSRLYSVSIYSSPSSEENWQRYDRLVAKYGKPLPTKLLPNATLLAKGISYQQANWEAKTGETLEFNNGYIQYSSRNSQNKKNSNLDKIKF